MWYTPHGDEYFEFDFWREEQIMDIYSLKNFEVTEAIENTILDF